INAYRLQLSIPLDYLDQQAKRQLGDDSRHRRLRTVEHQAQFLVDVRSDDDHRRPPELPAAPASSSQDSGVMGVEAQTGGVMGVEGKTGGMMGAEAQTAGMMGAETQTAGVMGGRRRQAA
ncbi:hypothetical protein CYMTET_53262, partial [Cymbomonas tetramitiformis]